MKAFLATLIAVIGVLGQSRWASAGSVMLTGLLVLTPGGSTPRTAHGQVSSLILPASAPSTIEAPLGTVARAACSSVPRAGDTSGSVVSDGVRRTYLLHVARHLAAGRHLPLVLYFHSYGADATEGANGSSWSTTANKYGFVAAYPNGTGSTRSWNEGVNLSGFPATKLDDVRFTARLIDALSTRLCIDPRRVYATGLSNGGGMVHRLACDLSGRIAAIAPESGPYGYTSCHPTRPVSVVAFHGDADSTIPYHGDKSQGLPNIQAWARAWAQRDGCARGPTRFFRGQDAFRQYTIVGIRYTGCRGASEVDLYTTQGGGHGSPPAVGHLGHATVPEEIIWRFFAAHPSR